MLDASPNELTAMASYLGPVLTGAKVDAPTVKQVPLPFLRELWPSVSDMIANVAERSDGRWTPRNIAERLATQDWQLWVVYDGSIKACLATECFREASGLKVARIVFCTGIGAKQWVDLVDVIEEWARGEGCKKLETLCRKGWFKHLSKSVHDYKMTHVLLEKDL